MSFDRADIRPAMEVYTLDNVYLGTVLAVTPGPPHADPTPERPATMHSSAVSGELMGPMPTQSLGNTGPQRQAAGAGYASAGDGAAPLGQGSFTVGKWYGLFGKRSFPLDAVQTVSMERIILRWSSVSQVAEHTAQGR